MKATIGISCTHFPNRIGRGDVGGIFEVFPIRVEWKEVSCQWRIRRIQIHAAARHQLYWDGSLLVWRRHRRRRAAGEVEQDEKVKIVVGVEVFVGKTVAGEVKVGRDGQVEEMVLEFATVPIICFESLAVVGH